MKGKHSKVYRQAVPIPALARRRSKAKLTAVILCAGMVAGLGVLQMLGASAQTTVTCTNTATNTATGILGSLTQTITNTNTCGVFTTTLTFDLGDGLGGAAGTGSQETGDGGDGGDSGDSGDIIDSVNADGGDSGRGGDGGPGGGIGGDGGGSGAALIKNSGDHNSITTIAGDGGPGTCTNDCFGGDGAESGPGGDAEAGRARTGDVEEGGNGGRSGDNNVDNSLTVNVPTV